MIVIKRDLSKILHSCPIIRHYSHLQALYMVLIDCYFGSAVHVHKYSVYYYLYRLVFPHRFQESLVARRNVAMLLPIQAATVQQQVLSLHVFMPLSCTTS